MANITITNKAKCVVPTLLNVTQKSADSILVEWDASNISYGATITLDYSIDNGSTWYNINIPLLQATQEITSSIFNSFSVGSVILFRLKSVATGCNTNSTSKSLTWEGGVTVSIVPGSLERDLLEGITTYKLQVVGGDFVGYTYLGMDFIDNIKSGGLESTPYGSKIPVTGVSPKRLLKPVSIPEGIYDCSLDLTWVAKNITNAINIQGFINYTYDSTGISYLVHVEAQGRILDSPE